MSMAVRQSDGEAVTDTAAPGLLAVARCRT
jgi:hypothetical protein